MIYSFSNTTSYSTFYNFFSSFRITLWPMWLTANDSLAFIHNSHTYKKTNRTDNKTNKPDGKPVLSDTTFSSVFRAVFYTVKLHSLTYGVWGPLGCMGLFRVYGALNTHVSALCQHFCNIISHNCSFLC